MSLSIGIVGLPNVGKSTLFNALTKKCVPAANYPFCTIDPAVGVVAVPDERIEILSKFSNSAKTIPGAIEFVDIAGLVKGAAEGQGLGNKFLSHIREVDAMLEVVRIFSGTGKEGDILHVMGNVDPIRDIEIINLELVLSDMQTVTKRGQSLGKELKKGDKEAVAENELLEKLIKVFEAGKLASTLDFTDEEKVIAKRLNLLTIKPILYALNKKAGASNLDESDPEKFKELIEFIKKTTPDRTEGSGSGYVVVDAKIEDELKEMSGAEKDELRKEFGVDSGDGINDLIKEGYKLLGLITYLTTGEDETRAWTIKEGSTAPVAGMAIHTDFRDKFIRAEVIFWKDLIDAGSFAEAKKKGLVRTEGKDYIVRDGDVVEFKI